MTSTRILGPFVLASLVMHVPMTMAADAVYRFGSRASIQGEIQSYTKTELKIKRGRRGIETIPANEISRVRWDAEEKGVIQARADEESGRLEKALAAYQNALAAAPKSAKEFQTELEFLIARTITKGALVDKSQQSPAVDKLEDFLKTHPNHYRFYETQWHLGNLFVAQPDFAKANSCYQTLLSAPWNDWQMTAKNSLARVHIRQDQFPKALALFEEVLAIDAANERERESRFDALLGRAECLKLDQQYDAAAASLQQILDEVSLDQTQLRAAIHLQQGSTYQTMGETKKALLAYLHIDVLPDLAEIQASHAEALFHLTALWKAVGQLNRSAETAARLKAEYPNSNWSQQLTNSR